jgi:hypothetical protein
VKPDKSVESTRWHEYLIRLVIYGLIIVIASACTNRTPTEAIQATINITKIVDEATQGPINTNIITLGWETPDSQVIKTEQYRDQSELTMAMPADGSVRLFVIVEAPGYEKWENVIRMKFNSTKPVSFPVEMERTTGLQG